MNEDSSIRRDQGLEQGPELAARLRAARRASGLPQQAAADALGVSRPLIVAIEQGTRAIHPSELVTLARLYGRSVSELVRPSPPLEGLGAQFRAALAGTRYGDELSSLVEELVRLGDDYLELARLSGAALPRRYPQVIDITGLDVRQAAEDIAVGERNRLGLGDGPLPELREVLNDQVGLRIFALQLPSHVAGLFVYAEPLGGCVAVNARHPVERQRWSLAHEFGHFLTSRTRAEVTVLYQYERLPAHERFADAFAANFLMPRAGLRRRYHELVQSRGGDATAADLLQLAHVYRVSLQGVVLRLEDLRLVPAGSFDRLWELGFRPIEAERMLGLRREPPDQQLLPLRFRYLAAELFIQGDITEGQLARFLRTDRVSARAVVEELTASADVTEEGCAALFRLVQAADSSA